MDGITATEKIVGIIIMAGGAVWAMWVNILAPVLNNIGVKRKEDQEKFQAMYQVLIGSNGSSVKSRLERIETRQILHEQTNKALMNSLKVGYWRSDKDGKCIDASRTLCSIVGRNEDEILGNNWATWLHPECKKRVYSAWEFSVHNGTEFNEEYRFIKPDGSEVKVRGVAYQLYDDHEHLVGFFGTLTKCGEDI